MIYTHFYHHKYLLRR